MSVPKDIIRLIVLIKCKSQLSQVSKQYHNEYNMIYETEEYGKIGHVRLMNKISKQPINYRLLHLSYHHYEQIWSIFSSKRRGKLSIKYFL